jgi:diguanylate cyclase (GGDEF)-like protein/PAS domain S-box-containing protein
MDVHHSAGRRARTRAIGWLIGAGAAMVLVWIALPHPERANDPVVIGLVVVTWALAGGLLAGRFDRASLTAITVVLGLCAAGISATILAIGDPASGFALFYVCLAPYAFAAGSQRHAVALTAAIAVLYGAVLVILASGEPDAVIADALAGRWLVVVCGSIALGLFARHIAALRRRSEDRFRRGFAHSPVGTAILTEDWRWLEVNDALCRMLGRNREQLLGHSPGEVTHPDDLAASRAISTRAFAGTPQQRLTKRYIRPDGQIVWATVDSIYVPGRRGEGWFYAHVQDITAERYAQEAIERQTRQQAAVAALGRFALEEQDLEAVMDRVAETVAATLGVELCDVWEVTPRGTTLRLVAGYGWPDGQVRRVLVQAGAESHAGFTLTQNAPVVTADVAQEHRFRFSGALLDAGARAGVTAAIASRTGRWGVLAAHAKAPREFAPDEIDFMRAVANVVSSAVDRSRVDEEVRHRAMHDPLTGLPNRALALDRLEGALARRRRDGRAVAVLLADLDQFKLVNDSMGHKAGDDLLVTLAPRLHDAVRPSDTVARLGGDEFLVVCEQLDGPHEAIRVAERVAQAINQPIVLASGEHFVSASIGIAVAERADADPADLLRDADAAMYRAKERGRGRYELFDDLLRRRVLVRLQTENELRRGIDQGELRVVYQPIIRLADDSVAAVEALARWQHPERGLLDPVDFIPVAEDSGLIGALGDAVLTTACRDVAGWQQRFPRAEPLLMCVNTSPRQLASPAFPARVADTMDRHGLAPGSLALEITESVLLEEAHAPVTVLASLREYGLRLMLDDFGTGYSSLSYLRRFPLDVLKIDRSFVAGLDRDEHDAAIVAAIVQMARTLGLTVVAEGVERPEQLERLRELGCDRAQGRLIAGPMPAAAIEALMASTPAP